MSGVFLSLLFFSAFVLLMLHSSFVQIFALYKVVRARPCLPSRRRRFRLGSPQLALGFLAPSPALCKNSTLVKVCKIVAFFFFFFFFKLFHVDAEQGASRRCYLISVHSHNPSHVKTLCHIFCCAFSFFLSPNIPSSYKATSVVYYSLL